MRSPRLDAAIAVTGQAEGIDGSPWEPGSPDILISAPGVHQAAVDALATVG